MIVGFSPITGFNYGYASMYASCQNLFCGIRGGLKPFLFFALAPNLKVGVMG
jgi:hypothetical protein